MASLALLVAGPQWTAPAHRANFAGKPVIPYPEALQDAGVAVSKMNDGQSEGLILGNGDLYGIVWEKAGGIFLRITKNDIWDARVDTAKDGPLPKVNIRTRAVTGSTGAPPSYGNAFPQPLCAAALRIGTSPVAQGTLDLQHAVATITNELVIGIALIAVVVWGVHAMPAEVNHHGGLFLSSIASSQLMMAA